MKKFYIPKDIQKYVFKRRIPYAILFILLMSVVAFICITSKYIPPIGVIIGLIVAFIIFYDLPVFKNNLFDKTWAGVVLKINDLNVTVPGKGVIGTYLSFKRYSTLTANFLMITLKNGDEVFDKTIRMPKNFPVSSLTDVYTPGSRILHIGGTKQYVVFKEEQKSYICPVCGIENKISTAKCVDCGHTLIKSLSENTGT